MALKLTFLSKFEEWSPRLKKIIDFFYNVPGYLPWRSWRDPRRLVSIELSSHELKLMIMSKHNKRYCIDYYATSSLAPDAIIENEIKKPDEITRSLKHLLDRTSLKVRYAITSLPSTLVIQKNVLVDETKNDIILDQQIERVASRHIPHKLENVSLDYVPLGSSETNLGKMNVLLVAAQTEDVANRVEVIEATGLEVKILDIDSYAMCRAVKLVKPQLPKNLNEDGIIAVVSIGATILSISVMQKDTLLYAHEEVFGGDQLTEAIQKHYGLSYEQAELAKQTHDLPQDYLDEIYQPFVSATVQQIARLLQFFFSSTGYEQIDFLLLAGSDAVMDDLVVKVIEETQIPTAVANPCANLDFGSAVNPEIMRELSPSLMLLLGLAMRGADI